jgi:3-oxoacyl-[acyl-carrier protein] reductase
MFELTDRIALVTGASRGLGKGIALSLARAGAYVIINYLQSSYEAETVVETIRQGGGDAAAIQADVSKEADVKRMFNEIADKFGCIEILVNNAGTSENIDIFDMTLESWKRIIDINLTSAFLCSKYALRIMQQNMWGRIVLISSVVGHQGALRGHIHYAATKSGQLGFAKTLARTAAPYNVTVNAVAPGIIETDLLYRIHRDDYIEALSESIPLGLGKIENVGDVVAFICSEEARYITGATIDVNGGMYCR